MDGPDGGKVERSAHSSVGQKFHEESFTVALLRSPLTHAGQRQVEENGRQQLYPIPPPRGHFFMISARVLIRTH